VEPTSTIKRTCWLLTAPLLAVCLAACGSTVSASSFKGEAHAVAQRLSDFQADVTSTNEQKLCGEDLARVVRTRLDTASGGCTQALKRQLGAIDDFELTVEKIAVSGATATAEVRSTWSGKLRLATLKLVKEGRSWRIASLG
jgi:hypothetical protein